MTNQTDENYTLTQIDFYGILSPTSVPEYDRTEEDAEEALNETEDDMVDHQIQARLHGYPEDVNTFGLKGDWASEPVPLRSIRVPLQSGMMMAWAPNGYGKTYMFEHLLSTIPKVYDTGFEGYLTYVNALKEALAGSRASSANITTIYPFHTMGLRMISPQGNVVDILLFLPTTESLESDRQAVQFYVSMQPQAALSPSDEWVYRPGRAWAKGEWVEGDFVKKGTPGFVVGKAINQWGNINVDYIETPKLGSKDDFYLSLVGMIEEPLYRDQSVHRLTMYDPRLEAGTNPFNGWGGSWRSFDIRLRGVHEHFNEFELPPEGGFAEYILEDLCDRMTFFTDSLCIGLVDFEIEQTRINQLVERFAVSLPASATHNNNVQTLMDQIMNMRNLQAKFNNLLFTWSDFNREARVESYDAMLEAVETLYKSEHENQWLTKLYEMMLVLRLSYVSELTHVGLATKEDIEEFIARCQSANSRYVDFRVALVRHFHGFEGGDHAKEVKSILESEFDEYKMSDIEYNIKQAWPWMIRGALLPGSHRPDHKEEMEWRFNIRENFWQRSRRGDSEVSNKFLDELNGNLDLWDSTTGWWDFFPTFRPHHGNPFVALLLMNENINPQNSAWGVEVYFNSQHEFGERPQNDKDKHGESFSPPIRFHRQGDVNDIIQPEYLSFGMRSELILQLALFKFTVENRVQRVPKRPSKRTPSFTPAYNLLILDESEVGRSEYWTQLLIDRFRRLEFQIHGAERAQVLVVSHRGLVLEDSTASSEHVVMHRVPKLSEEE